MHRSELEWSTKEDKLPSRNWKALNAIFKGVSPMQFKSISVTKSAKEALDIIRIEVVGTSIVRKSRIELLISKLKNLWMVDEEIIEQ